MNLPKKFWMKCKMLSGTHLFIDHEGEMLSFPVKGFDIFVRKMINEMVYPPLSPITQTDEGFHQTFVRF